MKKISKYCNFLYYINSLKDLKTYKKNIKIFHNKFNYTNLNSKELNINEDKFKVMKKAFKRLLKCFPNTIEIPLYFISSELKFLEKKINCKNLGENEPILICVVKDDLLKIKKMYEHHMNIGVNKFVFLDNGSTDGTVEFLKSKDNVDIITCETKYHTYAREAWINLLLCHYGFNNWYLVVDSDEMYNYIGSEELLINEHIKKLHKKGINRELSFMLDMYSKKGLFQNANEFTKDYCYFDCDTYEVSQNKRSITITGGPRKRNIKEKNINKSFMLGKYPLFYFEKGDLQSNSHYTFPYYKNLDIPCTSVLMHYKFIGNDIEKYQKRIEEKNYHNNSEDYKTYMNNYKNNKNLNFYYKNSKKYTDSYSLKCIEILKEI